MGSLGQPLKWHWHAGLGSGAWLEGPSSDVVVRSELGFSRGMRSSLTGLLELGGETYAGMRGPHPEYGFRGLLRLPYFGMGAGLDFNARLGRTDLLVTMQTPVRRGGLLTRGTMLRLDWYPMQSHSFLIGITAPLGDPLAGRTRPARDYVVVTSAFSRPPPHHTTDMSLLPALASARASAARILQQVVPFLDQDGRDNRTAVARTARYLDTLRNALEARAADAEVRFFHAEITRAFTIASGDAALGERLAVATRDILLRQVLLPYDAMLGRKKRGDTVRELSIAARGQFGRWVASAGRVRPGEVESVLFVFEAVTEILEEVRARAARQWDDPRLAWLPLQYALLPEDYDEQSELDDLIEDATGVRFTDGNHLTYVANLQFHDELLTMIHETHSYHVLWIHDFPALTNGRLDSASLAIVLGYLGALADRVGEYNVTETLPSYFIFLDQHYYELRRSRILMDVLEDPLHAAPHLLFASDAQNRALAAALTRLQVAVRDSRVLWAARREYGDEWLTNRIKVHVNITNRVDASFWSGGLISSVFGYPDDVMRDHRKIAFRDVSDADPRSGRAILTGMGVGQAYRGPRWDDRALRLEGPVVQEFRQSARELLLSQGLTEADLPAEFHAFVPGPRRRASLDPTFNAVNETRAAVFMNGTGYLPKPLNVARAILYSLMPAGAVLKIPDSLWNSSFYGALLVGACVRGAHVLVIAPALLNAPSGGFPQMARAHELLTRLLLARQVLGDAISRAGGELEVGLYDLPPDDSGFGSRAGRWAARLGDSTFLQALYPFSRSVMPAMAAARDLPGGATPPGVVPDSPKLHQKVQFIATREFWAAVTSSPEWPRFMASYLAYRRVTYAAQTGLAETRSLADSLERIADRVFAHTRGLPRAATFAIVGSQNQDYRGMFMDGEVGVLYSGAAALVPMVDLVFMAGVVTWIDTQETLDRLLPPRGEFSRRIARVTKDGL